MFASVLVYSAFANAKGYACIYVTNLMCVPFLVAAASTRLILIYGLNYMDHRLIEMLILLVV